MIGKHIAGRMYVHVDALTDVQDELRAPFNVAIAISKLDPGRDFNVLRLDRNHHEVALLRYANFFEDPFPTLQASWRIHVPTQSIVFRDYRKSLNPPVLHRKELLLPKSHPRWREFAQLTAHAESLGLLSGERAIGFRKQWDELLQERGYAVSGNQLLPISNATLCDPNSLSSSNAADIQRHLTALSRNFLSAPIQALIRTGLLVSSKTLFDYGCGKGDDIARATSLGYVAHGWDPHYYPTNAVIESDVVNIGFVLNVIEDIEERIEALERAYDLTRGVLAVSTMLWSSTTPRGTPFRDGFLTSRNTFQRYYTQDELRAFIEAVLDEEAIPIGPGIFFVFKDRFVEQGFLADRQLDRSRATRLLATCPRAPLDQLSRHRPQDPRKTDAIANIWLRALELGRLPEADEHPKAAEYSDLFGSWSRALRAVRRGHETQPLEDAAAARADEVRLFFAANAFAKRPKFRELEPRLQKDVKALFGSLPVAQAEGMRLLFKVSDIALIAQACDNAAADGLGYLDAGISLQLHSSLITRLDPVLRAYIACATALYGDLSSCDLVKVHIQSGKVTLMRFDDFDGRSLPRMIERVKVKLREQDFDVFQYGSEFPPPLLFFKSRYLNEEYPGYAEQLAFDETIAELGVVDTEGHGPTEVDFHKALRRARYCTDGVTLTRLDNIPSLDDPCGRYLTYRDFLECGETWNKQQVTNVPRSTATYNALADLAIYVLDPIIDYFGAIRLTYGFASAALTTKISAGIAPKLDQHSSCESNRRGAPICARGGAAVDFLVDDEDMTEVARWVADNTPYDRIYYYGARRPLHVSYGPEHSRELYEMRDVNGRRVPRKIASI